jgi:hypothetical protein
MPTTTRAILTLAAALACASFAAQAADGPFVAKLNGAQQMPDAIDTKATGTLELRPSADGKQIAYKISLADITNPSAADVHLGPATANGPLVVKLFPKAGGAQKKGPFTGVLAEGTITADDLIGPLLGASMDELLEALSTGNAYTNVHTNDGVDPPNSGPGDYRNGEIRGQIK